MLAKVNSGSPLRIPAADYNAFIDAAIAYKSRQRDVERVQASPPTLGGIVVPVYNATEATIERWQSLALTGMPVSGAGAESQIVFTGDTPTPAHRGQFAVAQEPIPARAFGQCVIAGATFARVNVIDLEHKFADVDAGEHVLRSACEGSAQILYSESIGEQTAIVRLGNRLGGCGSDNSDCAGQCDDSICFSVTISGLTAGSGTCAGRCSSFNSTYKLRYVRTGDSVGFGDQMYYESSVVGASGDCLGARLIMYVDCDGSAVLTLQSRAAGALTSGAWCDMANWTAAAIDCEADTTLSLAVASEACEAVCGGYPSTLTLSPVDCAGDPYPDTDCGGDCSGSNPTTLHLLLFNCAAADPLYQSLAMTCVGAGEWGGSGSLTLDWSGGALPIVASLTCLGGSVYTLDINGETQDLTLWGSDPMIMQFDGGFPALDALCDAYGPCVGPCYGQVRQNL